MGRRAGNGLQVVGAVLVACAGLAGPASAQRTCDRAQFEAAVSQAAAALRELNQKNRPTFQARLRELKDKRGWSHEQLMKDGASFVQDERIAQYDERSTVTLESIQKIGGEGAASQSPDCGSLAEVQALMQALVAIQTEKWAYMFGKIEQELGR